MLNEMTNCIKRVVKGLGEFKGCGRIGGRIRRFKQQFLPRCRDNAAYENDKVAKKETKKAIQLYCKLGTKDGENKIYKRTRTREMKTRDLNCVKCIKYEDQRVLVQEEEIKER